VQRLVFADDQAQRGQLVDLAPLTHEHRRVRTERCVASPTDRRPLLPDRVGHRHQPQRLAAVPQLPAGSLATALAQALRLAHQPVAGRRLATGVTVLGQPRLQFLHPRLQGHVHAQQALDVLALLVELGLKFGDPIGWRHAPMLRLLRKSG
jgi:hypothetical protein